MKQRARARRWAIAAAATAAVAVTACYPIPADSGTGWMGDRGCAALRDAVAHGEPVDYVPGAWLLHERRLVIPSPVEDGCWVPAPLGDGR